MLWHIPTIENCSFVNFFYNIILQVKKNVLGFQTFACVLRNRLMKTFLLLYNYTYPPFFETTYYYSRGGKLPCASQFLSHPIQHSFPLLGTIRICSIRTSFSLKHFLSSLYIYISGKITNALVNCLPKNGTRQNHSILKFPCLLKRRNSNSIKNVSKSRTTLFSKPTFLDTTHTHTQVIHRVCTLCSSLYQTYTNRTFQWN